MVAVTMASYNLHRGRYYNHRHSNHNRYGGDPPVLDDFPPFIPIVGGVMLFQQLYSACSPVL